MIGEGAHAVIHAVNGWTVIALFAVVTVFGCRRPAPEHLAVTKDPLERPIAPHAVDASSKRVDDSDGTAYGCGDITQVEGLVRERVPAWVDGGCEWWSLEWRTPPKKACSTWLDEGSGPCSGLTYGEAGGLDVVVRRDGKERERLMLDRFFDDAQPIVQRWPYEIGDSVQPGSDAARGIDDGHFYESRPTVRAMVLRDYDHDGHATEFVIRVGGAPWPHVRAIVIGVSRQNPRLHAFTTVETPAEPLTLEHPSFWVDVALAIGSQRTIVNWQCGDHGSETQDEITIRWDAEGLHAGNVERECIADGGVGGFVRGRTL